MDYYQVFIEIMEDFQKHYSYLSFKRYSINQLIERYSKFMKTVDNEKLFIKTLAKIFGLFEDGHIVFFDSHGKPYRTYNKDAIPNYNYHLTYKKYFRKGLKLHNKAGAIGFCGKYEDILYVNIASWSNQLYPDLSKLFKFFEFVLVNYKFVNKMILDVRSNGGGCDRYAEHFLSYLVPKGKVIPVSRYLYRLDKNNPKQLGREHVRYAKSSSHFNFEGPIVGLIGNQCMSSNEFFCMGLESIKHHANLGFHKKLTLVGDDTFGSSGNPKEFRHPSGIRYMIPSWVCYTSQGKLLEGNGVHPDIQIKSSSTIAFGRDKAFNTALKILK